MTELRHAELAAAEEACAREPIQHAGAIQPWGWLLVADAQSLAITHVSANIDALFAGGAAQMLGRPLTEFIDGRLLEPWRRLADAGRELGVPQHAGRHNLGDMAPLCEVMVHGTDQHLHVEIEAVGRASHESQLLATRVRQSARRLAGLADAAEFRQALMAEMRMLTGVDRVMVYRFLPDGTGEVAAESIAAGVEPWLGQRYPESDIPVQARALYLRSLLRVIPDAGYTPVPMHAADPDAPPLDMSLDLLRSISPVHRQYLRNMGVGAAVSLSVVVEGSLWGLILLQHSTPISIGAPAREALELLAALLSSRVAAVMDTRRDLVQRRLAAVSAVLHARAGQGPLSDASLVGELVLLARLVQSDGAAALLDSHWNDPDALLDGMDRTELAAWLASQPPDVLASSSRADWRASPRPDAAIAGVLAVPVAPRPGDWLLLLRRPYDEHIAWAGIPDKQVQRLDDGSVRIAPRADFAVWRELRRGGSEQWSGEDGDAAAGLQLLLAEMR